MAAVGAGAFGFVAVEFVEDDGEFFDDVFEVEFFFVEEVVAFFAIPLEGVGHTFGAFDFDDEADGVFEALGRMRDAGREEVDFAFSDGDVSGAAVVHDAQDHVAFELVEELGGFVVVIVFAFVGPAHDHNDKLAVGPHDLIADGRFEEVAVLVNPLLEVKRAGIQRLSHTDHVFLCW